MIVWNGKSSDDFGIVIEKVPVQTHPRRKVETVSVPGRNGDLVRAQNAWENYDQPFEIFAGEADGSAPIAFREIADWLYAPRGYARLEDSFDPDAFRLAHFTGPFDVDFTLMRVGRTTVTFNCKPQRFLKLGEQPITFTADGALWNPTQYEAKPFIRAYGTGTMSINGYTVTVTVASGYTDIDSELEDAYKGAVNCNANVKLTNHEYPVLSPGTNTLAIAGFSRVEITPKWWTI